MTYKQALDANFHHFTELQKIVEKHGFPPGGGSYMMDGQTLDYCPHTFPKQKLLFDTVQSLLENAVALEVGVYAGHSAFIMLIANPTLHLVCCDLGYPFTQPCIDYLNSQFGNRVSYHQENSLTFLPTCFPTDFDLIHVDGCHDAGHIEKEMELIEPLRKPNAVLVVDDIDGAAAGLTKVKDKLRFIEKPLGWWPNAVYQYKD
jgi:predicted O-methyltransferase YrrM